MELPCCEWKNVECAFRNKIIRGRIINNKHLDLDSFFVHAKILYHDKIECILLRLEMIKIFCVLECYMVKMVDGINEYKEISLITKTIIITRFSNINEHFQIDITDFLNAEFEKFQENGSGWAFVSLSHLDVYMLSFESFRGSSYVQLPAEIVLKRACINVQNLADKECFKWSILSALYPQPAKSSNANRVSTYKKYEKELNFTGITFPMSLINVHKFEKQNPTISVNVYILKRVKRKVKDVDVEALHTFPVLITDEEKLNHINLLLFHEDKYYESDQQILDKLIINPNESLEEEKELDIPYHFAWIKNFSRLVTAQLSEHNGAVEICNRCLHYFINTSKQTAVEKLIEHKKNCKKLNEGSVRLPDKDNNILEFKNFKNNLPVPYVITADFECILKKIDNSEKEIGAKSVLYQKHESFSVGYYLEYIHDASKSYYKHNRSPQNIKWFVDELYEIAMRIEDTLPLPMPKEAVITRADTHCHICGLEFTAGQRKTRDHSHLSEKEGYRGAAHQLCNLQYQDNYKVPVMFHNLSGYDAHLLIEELAVGIPGHTSVLPITKEKYISFTKYVFGTRIQLVFIDTYKFLNSSLDELSGLLKPEDFIILKSEFQHVSDEDFKLLTRKGIFPYDYIDDIAKLDETELPPIEKFYNMLNDTHLTAEEHVIAKQIYVILNCKNLGDYSDGYLKVDVLLLVDVFKRFRKMCMQVYGLDPAHYYTLPGFTWDAMLKYTRVKLELLTDIDMVLFIELGIRGGLVQCSGRYSKANNKYMQCFDKNLETKFLIYFDVNNLYGAAMSEYLPIGKFAWVENCENFEVLNISDDNRKGYILEVDLDYPENLHDPHFDLPYLPNHQKPPGCKEKRLMTSLENKKNYVIHYKNLKQCLRAGLLLKKVHKVLEFSQTQWLKSYIDLNTRLRTAATDNFSRNLFKLMVNSTFGKTIENVRKYQKVNLHTYWDGRYGARVRIASPRFESLAIFSENFVAIQSSKDDILMNKPIYVGMAILDLSKIIVYEFHEYMIRLYGTNCRMLYTDTDSLIYEVICEDIYEDIKKDIHRFDTSAYAPNNQFNMPLVNKKVIGLMKDENNGMILTEFCGLRSKMYATLVENGDGMKKSKGVKRCVVEKTICFQDYVNCMIEKSKIVREQNTIKSHLHNLYSLRQTRIALSAHDNKRLIDPIDVSRTWPYGHKDIPKV